MARGKRCEAHTHESITAEENHHLQPLSRGGLTVATNLRYLCANAHSDTHYLLDLIEDQARLFIGTGVDVNDPIDAIPWLTMRTYGPGVRNAAITGWLRYGQAFLRGDYRKHAALWSTSGEPRTDGIAARLPGSPPRYVDALRLDVVESWTEALDRVAA